MAQYEPVARIEDSAEMDGQESANWRPCSLRVCAQLTSCGDDWGGVVDRGPQVKSKAFGRNISTLMVRALSRFRKRRAITSLSVYTLCCRRPKLSHDRTLVAAMQQIADWLKKLGMDEYVQRFVENRVDLRVLPDLTDQDLEKLGSCSAIAAKCSGRSAISALLRLA
jgi:DNA-directed RNA polymerase subunit N (RpoN/RPB10)